MSYQHNTVDLENKIINLENDIINEKEREII